MDDYNISSLNNTRNEYCALFINRLTPLMIQGIYSIYNEACKLCADNDEDEKYLMTFQNFLGRISKWNSDIIQTETDRIRRESGCNYLEDLLTCVHVSQLKILTTIRVGQKQKKIDIEIPKLEEYVHKSYVEIARKVYKNAFLFEANVAPLVRQRNLRELETIVREALLNVIRDNMPVDKILRAYIDETTEEDVYEVKEDTHEVIEELDDSVADEDVLKLKEQRAKELAALESNEVKENNDAATNNEETVVVNKSPETATIGDQQNTEKEGSVTPSVASFIKVDTQESTSSVSEPVVNNIIKKEVTDEIASLSNNDISSGGLSFNDNDNVKTYDTSATPTNVASSETKIISAPKTIERLEEISDIRAEQRRLEEEEDEDYEDERIKIFDDSKVELDVLDVNNISRKPIQLNDDPILGEITTLV